MPSKRPVRKKSASTRSSSSSSSRRPPEAVKDEKQRQKTKDREEAAAAIQAYLQALDDQQEQWRRTAAEWRSDPKKLSEWFAEQLLMQLQLLSAIVFHSPPGMVDLKDKLKAAADLRDLGELMDESLSKAEEEKGRRRQ